MNKRISILLSLSIAIILFSFLGCSHPKKEFDKQTYLEECGLSLDGMLLSPEVADSLILEALNDPFLLNEMARSLKLYMRYRDYRSCDSVCYAFSNYTINNELIDNKLRNHFLSIGYGLSTNAKELLDITLSYAKRAPFSQRIKIGESSFKYAKSINDTLAARCVLRTVEGLSGDDSNDVTKEIAKEIIRWCKTGIPIQNRAFEDNYLLISLARAGYIANDKHADEYADLLFERIRDDQDRVFYDAIKKRVYSAYKKCDYSVAEDIIDYYINLRIDDSQKQPKSLKMMVHERVWPNSIVEGWDSNLTNRLLYQILGVLYDPSGGQDMQLCLEKSKLRFFQKDSSYSDWLTHLFFMGIDLTFPSMTQWIEFEKLLSPRYLYYPKVIELMTYQYNNLDPRSIFDACLYIKGTSDLIPIQIYNSIKRTSSKRIKAYADSIRVGLEPRGSLSKSDSLIRDSLEVSLVRILDNCLYSWENVRNSLKDHEVAIEYLVCPTLDLHKQTVYKAAIVRKESDYPVIVELCDEVQIRKVLKKGQNHDDLYDLIWEPLEEYVNDGETIYYSTDGLLNLVNLQAISSREESPLMDEYEMHQVSSTREVIDRDHLKNYSSISLYGGLDYVADFSSNAEKTERPKSAGRIDRSLCRGDFDYLPHSLDEVNAISKTAEEFGIVHVNHIGNKGTEESFYSTSTHPSEILHIATHGFYYSKAESSYVGFYDNKEQLTPLDRCGLVLSRGQHVWKGESLPEGVEDGILLGSEIIRLDLEDVDLVVLSACNTALGDISGEGIAGLRQAFKRAGVQSLLMTLAKVDDEATSFFMTAFYENLFSGKDKHTSFKEAVNTMRSSKRFSDPKYWSPFILID